MPFKSCVIVVDFISVFRESLFFFVRRGAKGGPLKQELGTQTLIQNRILYLFESLSGSLTFMKCLRKHSGSHLRLPHICIPYV